MPGVTIASSYGTAGSVIAPAVAERLNVPLLDRAISVQVAAQLQVSVDEAETARSRRSFADRFLALLTPLAAGVLGAGTDAAPPNALPPPDQAEAFREQAERVMREALPAGVVILGRAGGAALRHEHDVLRVRLFGAEQARLRHAVEAEQVDERTAVDRMRQVDRARDQYVRRLYHCSVDDPALYHLQIDSTALPADACADLIVAAYRALVPTSRRSEADGAAQARGT